MRLDKSYKTAIKRAGLSAPIKLLKDTLGVFSRGDKVLDYGCGRGMDSALLGIEKYDPYYFPERPSVKFSLILCTYVLNTLSKNKEHEILGDIKFLLRSQGKAYITVRRDVKRSGYRKSGTYQRNVKLDLPLVYERKGKFAIYVLSL